MKGDFTTMIYAVPETNVAINTNHVSSVVIPKDNPTCVEFHLSSGKIYLAEYDDADCALEVFEGYILYANGGD